MTLTRAEAIDASYPNAADIRKHSNGYLPREGIFPDPVTVAPAGVAFAGAAWAISARAFVAILKRGGAPYSQTYGAAPVSNDGTVTAAWTVASAPGAGSRIDRLCVRARDTTQGDSATGAPTDGPSGAARTGFPEFLVAAGSAGTPGVAPALPAGYFEVAQITVSAGNASAAAATIVQTYDFACVVGSTIYAWTVAERNLLAGIIPGDDVYVIGTGQSFIYVDATVGWVHLAGKPVISSPTFGVFGGVTYSTGAPAARVVEQAGMIRLEGGVGSSSAAFAAVTAYQVGTIPSTLAPVATRVFPVFVNNMFGWVTVDTSGNISVSFSSAPGTVALNLSLSGLAWPDKRLG